MKRRALLLSPQAPVLALWAVCIGSCGSSRIELGTNGFVVDAGADAQVDLDASTDASATEREAAPPMAPLDFEPNSPLVFQSATEISLPDAEQGKPYVQVIRVRTGTGVAPYHLAFPGLAPAGFAVVIEDNDTAGAYVAVVGTGSDLGVSHLRLDLIDAAGAKLSSSFGFRVVEIAPTILPSQPPTARAGVSGYMTSFEAKDGTPPLVWSASGLPMGMSIDPATGALGGVPDATAGDHDVPFTVTVTDSRQDPSSNVPTGRSVSINTQLHVDPGYRVNVFALLRSSICTFCHGDVGNSVYYKPRIAGIPTPPAGSENASGLVGQHPGGTAGDGHVTVCDPSMSYVIPGDPENSLLYQKISGTLAAPPPCGSCMPYQGSCNNEPTIAAAGRDLVRHWIMSLPPTPTGKDLE